MFCTSSYLMPMEGKIYFKLRKSMMLCNFDFYVDFYRLWDGDWYRNKDVPCSSVRELCHHGKRQIHHLKLVLNTLILPVLVPEFGLW